MSTFRRDLMHSLPPLHRFPQRPDEEIGEAEEEEVEAGEGIELSLGLSLNGRFGVDPRRANKNLSRSSSIPDLLNQSMAEMGFPSSLMRTCSLPAETEEECRKRKEIQSLRRLEVKRKRDQKQRSYPNRDQVYSKDHLSSTEEGQRLINGTLLQPRALSQQGSIVSQGSGTGSSGVSSESDVQQQFHAAESVPRPPAVPGWAHAGGSAPTSGRGLPPKGGAKAGTNVPEEMPFVCTKGSGPDGKRVEGFLYRYRKGEVRIVCVCHGNFLSPAEFVRHAGGGDIDVTNPLRQILMLPSS